MIEASERQFPVIETSNIIAGSRVEMNLTDFRQEPEENGASGVVIHLSVSESALVGSLICSLSKAQTTKAPLYYTIIAAESNSSLFHFQLSKETGELNCKLNVQFALYRQFAGDPILRYIAKCAVY